MTPKNRNTTKPRKSTKRPDCPYCGDWAERPAGLGKPNTKADEIWLVDYECRTTAILIAPQNNGFFAFGQDALWGFSNIAEWHICLLTPSY